MTNQVSKPPKQGAVIGGWVCLVLATALMVVTLLTFFLYFPLFLAAFVLGIVAIAQKRLINGVTILLLSVAIPLVLGLTLGVSRTSEAIVEIQKAAGKEKSKLNDTERSKNAVQAIDKQEYIQKSIKLYELQAQYIETYSDGRVPGVKFKIQNNGTRTLSRVKVLVLFKDKNGTVIGEEEYSPVHVTEYSYLNDNKPLKPGYIWKPESDKYYIAKSIPSEWADGSVEASINDVEFEE